MTDNLVWLDLETAGLDEHNDPILEMAMVVTDSRIENEIACWETTVWDPAWDDGDGLRGVSQTVMAMHTENGLWDDCARNGVSIREAQATAILTLSQLGGKGSFVMAGSGVSHFDQRFIRHQTPQLADWFRYYTIDVGITRRLLRSIGAGHLLRPEQPIAHRAMADVRLAIAQARYLKGSLLTDEPFVNQILLNAPESYDGDEAAEAIAVRYVRDMEKARAAVTTLIPAATSVLHQFVQALKAAGIPVE